MNRFTVPLIPTISRRRRRRKKRGRERRRSKRPPVEHSLAFSPNELSFLITNKLGEMQAYHNNENLPGRAMAARLFPLLSWNASVMHIGRNWTGKSMTPADPKKIWQPASALSTQSQFQC